MTINIIYISYIYVYIYFRINMKISHIDSKCLSSSGTLSNTCIILSTSKMQVGPHILMLTAVKR